MGKYILGIDQSTQATKIILVDRSGKVVARAGKGHRQIVNELGWVEHDLTEIWENLKTCVADVMNTAGITESDLICISICNQRETVAAWDKTTGEPLCHAVVWQCSRAKNITAALEEKGLGETIRARSGMQLSPYFSAAKASWLLKNVPETAAQAEKKNLCIGTIDAYLVFRMTKGEVFATDYSNAARTQLLNIHTLDWDPELCAAFEIPADTLPELRASDAMYGETDFDGVFEKKIPICGIMGDSNGALYGEGGLQTGAVKATYGTGSSIMMNIGEQCLLNESGGVVTSVGWHVDGKICYVLEGNINYSAAVIRWLEKDLLLIDNPVETAELARSANPADTTYVVPAFSGLGSPYWDNDAQGMICGMTRVTGKAEFVKASLECIDYQITDILKLMEETASVQVSELHANGGASRNPYLMQFQSDIMNCLVSASSEEEISCLGPVFAAAKVFGLDIDIDTCISREMYQPVMEDTIREEKYLGWKKAVDKCLYRG